MLKLITQPTSKVPRLDAVNLRPGESAPNFALSHHRVSAGFFANLRYLLTERAPIPKDAERSALLPHKFRASFVDNLTEHFRPAPKLTGDAVHSLRGAASPGIKIEHRPLYLSFFLNIRDAIIPPKHPPLELTSQPVDVPEIWSKHRKLSAPTVTSAIVHVIFIAVVVTLTVRHVTSPDPVKPVTILIAPPPPGAPPPPSQAAAPPPALPHRVPQIKRKSFFVQGKLTAPTVIPKVTNAKRSADDVAAPDLGRGVPGGDPAGVLGGVLGGDPGGIPGGILGGGSVTPPPPGVATTKSGIVRVGGNVKQPKAIYQPRPEFPSLAQHAHITGVVILDAVIDEQGNVVKLHPISGQPLLIPAALKAVATWKFEPTYLDGKPTSIEMQVTVSFNIFDR
jgi:periplasmic protein TonB